MYNQYNLEANPLLETLLPAFRKFLIAEKAAGGTVRSYVSDVRSFFDWLIAFLTNAHVFEADSPISANTSYLFSFINKSVLASYSEYLRNNNVPLKTINRRYSALRKLGSFSVSLALLAENIFESLKTISDTHDFSESEYHLEEFKTHLWQTGAAKSTIKNYLGDVRQYLQWNVGAHHDAPAINRAIRESPLQEHLIKDHLIGMGLSPTSIERKMSSVGAYLSFLEGKQSLIPINKTEINQNAAADYIKRLAALGIDTKNLKVEVRNERLDMDVGNEKWEERKRIGKSHFSRLTSNSSFSPPTSHFYILPVIALFIFALGIGVYIQFGQKEGQILGSSTIISPLSSKNDSHGSPTDFRGSSSGSALIPSGSIEIKIKSPTVTKNSLVYLTPIGSTDNQVLYIKELNYIEKTITIGFDEETTNDIKFNWWIVN